RLGRRALRQQAEDVRQRRIGGCIGGVSQVGAQVPLGKDGQFFEQAGLVVGRQPVGGATRQRDQGAQRAPVMPLQGGLVLVQAIAQGIVEGAVAQVGQQQEALVEILGQDVGNAQSAPRQQARDADEWRAILVGRRS